MDIQAALKEIFEEVTGACLPHDTSGFFVDDIEQWDSLAHMNIIFAVEEKFGLQFSEAELEQSMEYDQLLALLAQKI